MSLSKRPAMQFPGRIAGGNAGAMIVGLPGVPGIKLDGVKGSLADDCTGLSTVGLLGGSCLLALALAMTRGGGRGGEGFGLRGGWLEIASFLLSLRWPGLRTLGQGGGVW